MICVLGGKGAPGASTVALLLAALRPGGGVLVEADPAGSEAALRLTGPSGQTLPSEPNLARLAIDTASGASRPDLDVVLGCALQTASGVPVVCGLSAGAAMAQTVTRYATPLAACLGELSEVVIDAGRLTPGSAALPLVAAASVVVLVVADGADYFYTARDQLGELVAGLGTAPAVEGVVVTAPRRGQAAARELTAVLAARGLPVEVAGWIARDPRGLRRFLAGQPGARRTVLLRTAQPLANALAAAVEQRTANDHATAGDVSARGPAAPEPHPTVATSSPNGRGSLR